MVLSIDDFNHLSLLMQSAILEFIAKGKKFNPNNKTGGCLAYDDNNGGTNFKFLGSNIDDEKKYYETAFCKIQQLKDNPGHISSFQSRNPDNGFWGGGVMLVGKDGYMSFSGLPELGDEACLLKALLNAKHYRKENVKAILALSNNPIYTQIFR